MRVWSNLCFLSCPFCLLQFQACRDVGGVLEGGSHGKPFGSLERNVSCKLPVGLGSPPPHRLLLRLYGSSPVRVYWLLFIAVTKSLTGLCADRLHLGGKAWQLE